MTHECHCDGDCQTCRVDDLCARVSNGILAIDREQEAVRAQLDVATKTKALRSAVVRLTGVYTPAADMENAEHALRDRLAALVAERQRLLETLCELCPADELCRAR